MLPQQSSTADVPDPTSTNTFDVSYGLEINTSAEITSVEILVSELVSGATRAAVANTSGTILYSTTSGVTAGETVTVDTSQDPLTAGETYYVVVDAEGSSFTYSFNNTDPTTTSELADVTAGVQDAFSSPTTDNTVYNINSISFKKAATTAGSAIIEWDRGIPEDIFEWDIATFTRTLDGETVDVFVAYDDGTGWTRTNEGNAISRNYSLRGDAKITPDVDVRIEAELSRADTANNPTLDSAYRSWLV